VTKGLFLCKFSKPVIQPAIALLATHVQSSSQQDWIKLMKLLLYFNNTSEGDLVLKIYKSHCIKWYVDGMQSIMIIKAIRELV
jgi:hypothetical protein